MAGLAVLVSLAYLKGSHDFLHTFSMAFYHKWDVQTGFTFALQFFMLISDGLGGVIFVYLKCLLFKEVHVQIFLLTSIIVCIKYQQKSAKGLKLPVAIF